LEFTVGGDPSLPLRALVSIPNPGCVANDDNSDSSYCSDDEGEVSFDCRQIFLEVIFWPAICKLARKAVSRSKGCGNPNMKKWHVHTTDWARLTLETDKIAAEINLAGYFL